MPEVIKKIAGPRVPPEEMAKHTMRYAMPAVFLSLARMALLISLFLPYWRMTLNAPQYPEGLHVVSYINRLTGDVGEIDELNHYIGMRKLDEAARFEKSVAIMAVIALILMVEGAVHVHTKWALLLTLPAILFPALFLIDLHWWLVNFGQHLDPHAPLSNAIKPFSPKVIGTSSIGQFKTVAMPGLGLILAFSGSVLSIVGLYFHRRAYKPLVQKAMEQGA